MVRRSPLRAIQGPDRGNPRAAAMGQPSKPPHAAADAARQTVQEVSMSASVRLGYTVISDCLMRTKFLHLVLLSASLMRLQEMS